MLTTMQPASKYIDLFSFLRFVYRIFSILYTIFPSPFSSFLSVQR